MARTINRDYDFRKVSSIKDALISGTPDKESGIGYDPVAKRITHHNGTAVEQLAHLSDITKAEGFQGELAVAYPTAADLTNGAAEIAAGDSWIFNTSGTLATAPKFGSDVVEAGDKIIALVDNAVNDVDFATIQSNVDLTSELKIEEVTMSLVANAEATVTLLGTPAKIGSFHTRLSTGESLDVDSVLTTDSLKLTSNEDLTDIVVTVVYNV